MYSYSLTIFILMDFPKHIYTISMDLSILYLKWSLIVFILANSADPDEMPRYVAFHEGLHCCPKYLLTFIQNENGKGKSMKWLQALVNY